MNPQNARKSLNRLTRMQKLQPKLASLGGKGELCKPLRPVLQPRSWGRAGSPCHRWATGVPLPHHGVYRDLPARNGGEGNPGEAAALSTSRLRAASPCYIWDPIWKTPCEDHEKLSGGAKPWALPPAAATGELLSTSLRNQSGAGERPLCR